MGVLRGRIAILPLSASPSYAWAPHKNNKGIKIPASAGTTGQSLKEGLGYK